MFVYIFLYILIVWEEHTNTKPIYIVQFFLSQLFELGME